MVVVVVVDDDDGDDDEHDNDGDDVKATSLYTLLCYFSFSFFLFIY